MKRKYKYTIVSLALLIQCFSSCKKQVEIDSPSTSLSGINVYSTDATAAAVLTNIYGYMSAGTFPFATGINSLSVQCGLSSDELAIVPNASINHLATYKNSLTNQIFPPFWGNLYYFLNVANSAIEGLNNSTSLTSSVKQQLLGEAIFIRALCHFYLVNLYGEIPIILTSDYKITSRLPRSAKTQVYDQIVSDLKEAQNLLSTVYVDASTLNTTTQRVRPNKWVATALLARVYLYLKEWINAEEQASLVLNNGIYSLETDLNNVFLKNSSEAIWQLQPVNAGWNTEDGRVLVLPTNGPNSGANPVYLSSFILNAFEPGDQRKLNWIGSRLVGSTPYYYPNKYKINTQNPNITAATGSANMTEYLTVFRIAEIYLIRAEARAKQNNLSGAINDIDMIRQRANVPLINNINPGISQAALLTAILHERQVELFTEWGHRWFDLKRTENVDDVMSIVTPQKGSTWNSNWALYPVPLRDIQYNQNLTQNMGY